MHRFIDVKKIISIYETTKILHSSQLLLNDFDDYICARLIIQVCVCKDAKEIKLNLSLFQIGP